MTNRQSSRASGTLGAKLRLLASVSFVGSVFTGACGGSATTSGGSAGGSAAGSGALSSGSANDSAQGGGTSHGGTSFGGAGFANGGAAGATHHGGSSAGGASQAGAGGVAAAGEAGDAGEGGTGSGGTSGAGNSCDSTQQCCPTVRCGCPYPAGNGTNDTISDLESGNTLFKPAKAGAAGYWDLSRDASQGTLSPTSSATLLPVDGGADGSSKALHITGKNLTGWGAALAAMLSNGCPFDASKYGGISFYAKGTSSVLEGANQLIVLVGNPEYVPKTSGGFCDPVAGDPRCYARHRVGIELSPGWKQYIIAWEDLQAASFGNPLPFAPNRVRDIVFSADGPAKPTDPATSFDFWIDQLAFVPLGTKGNL